MVIEYSGNRVSTYIIYLQLSLKTCNSNSSRYLLSASYHSFHVSNILLFLFPLLFSCLSDRYGFSTLDDPSVKAVRASLNNEIIPYHLLLFERIAAKSKTGWIANTEGKYDICTEYMYLIVIYDICI